MRARSIIRDSSGAALVEFALVSPVLLLLILGIFDMGYNYYIQSQLQGAVQKAARDSTIEGAAGRSTTIDARVERAVRQIVPSADVDFSRKSYSSFTDVGRAEEFSDIDGNGTCNDGEPFEDANDNGVWDRDRGADGFGGARDAVLYVVTVSYQRAFGVTSLIGVPATFTTNATTVLRNQPYSEQSTVATVGQCL
ncbi:TadE/TadG family type IV pilus assembly protein [Pelagerythrobacter marensis]|uniref:Dihydrolipoamide acetyltransferase n=1 Tax=Pelagerythrobacter marensis TaxID=543877 RepID=A0A0G3X8Y3_9SPHN|nr:TadE family protein [Pelagerythrobacter marensis]AKM07059.1 Dihydrolipoamide acetyltransferase [Pelagerythrobacter marensis]